MSEFTEGDQLRSIFWPEGGYGLVVGKEDITQIIVVMEYGQMAKVPWFAVYKGNVLHGKYNAALCEGVTYL